MADSCLDRVKDSTGHRVVIAGHVCLDLIPPMSGSLPDPGMVAEVGPIRIATGGAVLNVGTALHRLGTPVLMVGLVGNDLFGSVILQLVRNTGVESAIRAVSGHSTSYSIVLAPSDLDRAFLHCPGVNAVFRSDDVRDEDLNAACWMHFGYPPVMPAMYAGNGGEFQCLFERALRRGVGTSLDMCPIDSRSEAANVDWVSLLRNVLPFVSVFTAGAEELTCAIGQYRNQSELATQLIDLGATVVLLKRGTQGLYLRTTANSDRLAARGFGEAWLNRELLAPPFDVQFVNAIGAGDCAIAGFIAAIHARLGPEQAITTAAATGASAVESADASSGVPHFQQLQLRLRSGWLRQTLDPPGHGWQFINSHQLWTGPSDHLNETS